MTALCSGGTSSLRPGAGQNIVFDAGLITAGLSLITPYLLPFAALIDTFAYEAVTQCGSDPPAMPSSSDLDVKNAIGGVLNPGFNAWLSAVHDLLLNYAWHGYCQCDSVSTPTPVYPPPTADQGGGTGSTSGPCFVGTWSGTPWDDTANPPLINNLSSLIPMGSASTCGVGSIPCTSLTAAAPTQVQGTLEVNSASRDGLTQLFFIWYKADGTFISSTSAFATASSGSAITHFGPLTVPALTARMYISAFVPPSEVYFTSNTTVTLQWYCGNTPGGQTACCDSPTSINGLSELYALLQNVYAQVNLLQRYRLPFAYIPGAAHSALTGSGSFSVSRLVGVKVSGMTIPSHYGVVAGNPDYHFDLGWLSIETGDGFINEVRLHADGQVWLPDLMPMALTLGYYLNPGVVATVTELEAEP